MLELEASGQKTHSNLEGYEKVARQSSKLEVESGILIERGVQKSRASTELEGKSNILSERGVNKSCVGARSFRSKDAF